MIAILIASTEEGTPFYLNSRLSTEYLRQLRLKNQFFCPQCQSPVMLKAGDVIIPHFAHLRKSTCSLFSESESPLHLLGKHTLFQFFQNLQIPVSLEQYFSEIKQRADLAINSKFVIEFQCSPISAEQVRSRTAGYYSIGLVPFWIAAAKTSQKAGPQKLRLKQFEQEFLRISSFPRSLLFYNPEKSVFIYFTDIHRLNGSTYAGITRKLEGKRQRFPFAAPKRCSWEEYRELLLLFEEEKVRLVRSKLQGSRNVSDIFWRSCYLLKLQATDLPHYVGIPVSGGEVFSLSPVVWQLAALEALQSGKTWKELLLAGRIPYSDFLEAEALLTRYAQLVSLLMKVECRASFTDVLYAQYCKTT